MPTDFLTDLRTRRGFALSEVYSRLHADGMLDWGAFGPQWQTAVLPGLLARPPLLLFADGFEPLDEAGVQEELASFYDDTPPQVLAHHRLLPFGGDGSGDSFCLCFSAATADGRVPVVHRWHDSGYADFLAADLQDFIFMRMLDVSDEPTGTSPFARAQRDGGLARFLDSHRPYLRPAHADALAALYQRPFAAHQGADQPLTLLSDDEKAALIARLAPFARAGERFTCAPPETQDWGDRCVGQLVLTLSAPAPAKGDTGHEPLRRLNWRLSPDADAAERGLYLRHGHPFLGTPAWSKLDGWLQDKLLAVQAAYPGAQLRFIDDDSGAVHALSAPHG